MKIGSIGIIGHGAFGAFLETLAKKHFPEAALRIFSRREVPDGSRFFSLEDACAADVLVIASSIRSFEEVLAQAVARSGPDAVIVEVNTVKLMPVRALRAHAAGRKYVATHPMFGPYSYEKQGGSLEGLRLVISEHTLNEDEYGAALALLRALGLSVIETDADTHDRKLAETLFLTHYLSQSIAAAGFVRTDIDTLSFGYLMDAVESTKNDLALFRDVFEFNPYCTETVRRLKEAQGKVEALLAEPR